MKTCENCGAIITQENTRAKSAQGFQRIKYCSDCNGKRRGASTTKALNKPTERAIARRKLVRVDNADIVAEGEEKAAMLKWWALVW